MEFNDHNEFDYDEINVHKNRNFEMDGNFENKNNRNMLAKDIARKIKSFEHFIYLWGHKNNYYLPPKHVLTWRFVSQVLTGEKKLLKNSDVGRSIDIPKMRGIRVNQLFESLKSVNEFHSFFPDMAKTDSIPRNYFFDVKSSDNANCRPKCISRDF